MMAVEVESTEKFYTCPNCEDDFDDNTWRTVTVVGGADCYEVGYSTYYEVGTGTEVEGWFCEDECLNVGSSQPELKSSSYWQCGNCNEEFHPADYENAEQAAIDCCK